MDLSKWVKTLDSRKFVFAALSVVFLALNAHFGWLPSDTAFLIVSPLLAWAGIEGYIDAKRAGGATPAGISDVIGKVADLFGPMIVGPGMDDMKKDMADAPAAVHPTVLAGSRGQIPKEWFVLPNLLSPSELQTFQANVMALAEVIQTRLADAAADDTKEIPPQS